MSPSVTAFRDLPAFSAEVDDFLHSSEVIHSLFIGLLQTIIDRGEPSNTLGCLAKVEDLVTLAAFMTGHRLLLAGTSPGGLAEVADALFEAELDPPGVVGQPELVQAFAAKWTERRGCMIESQHQQGIYELRTVIPAKGVEGNVRIAEMGDLELLIAWIQAFEWDVFHREFPRDQAEALVLRKIEDRSFYLWTVDEIPVSLAALSRPTRSTITVNAVYTPPEYRGRGYASVNVATISQIGLDSGKPSCVLYTDLANPTSNSIYQKIGYVRAGDSQEIRFSYGR